MTARPAPRCVWRDGYWEWISGRWQWRPSAWLVPPDGCHFAPPLLTWQPTEERGELYFLSAGWYPTNPKSQAQCGEAEMCEEVLPTGSAPSS